MSDFCKDCSMENFNQDFGDLANLCKEGETVEVLCEGCGVVVVDHNGVADRTAKTTTQPVDHFRINPDYLK